MPAGVETVYALKDLFAIQLPTIPTIYNVTLSANVWTEVVSGLTNVAVWLLYNKSAHNTNRKLEYAFVPVPSTYRSLEADTILVENTSLTQLYCRSTADDDIELEIWELEREAS